MKRMSIVGMALAAMVLSLAGAKAWADGDAKDKQPAKEAIKSSADTLTDESLKERLENLGFEPQLVKSKTGSAMYLLNFERDNYRYVFYVSLATDRSRLWLSAALRQLPEPKAVRADILEKILARNDEIGPTHFSVRSQRWLYLELALSNRDLTSRQLRKEIDTFATDIRQSEHLWNPARYPDVAATAAQAPKTTTSDDKASATPR